MESDLIKEEVSVAQSISGSDEIEELIKNLEDQCKISEKSGNFLEADKIYQRILELKKQAQIKKREILIARQKNEVSDIELAYQEELKLHNTQWQEKLTLFKQSCKDAEDQLIQKQKTEYESNKILQEESTPIIPKHSPELLNLKRIQDTLVRNKEYKEAYFVQQQMIELEEKLKSTWGVDREAKIQQNLAQIVKKQDNEMASFKQKILSGAEELKKMRNAEYESLIKKYQNLRKELVITQKLERNRFEGKHTTGCGTMNIDLNQSSRAMFRTPMSSRPATAIGDRSLTASLSVKNLSSP
ncbi:hypothetical protein SteCoe_33584 [Stentor coeruleus]|uniref:Uncharacterized protein n=1 Tax=Stentor coeruleus TaxID=5963 RepID=A0A1R2AWG3_9CILI|nr:hypothetical protein SteCoe_33584 [Stentor coeruleus]